MMMMKVVRWGVKDWVNCFSAACAAIPSSLDEEETGEVDDHHNSTKLPDRAMVFDPLGKSRRRRRSRREINRKNSSRRTRKKYEEQLEKEIVECPMGENTVSIEEGRNERRWQSFADEEYIVFCFRDDRETNQKKVCCSNHEHVEDKEKSITSTNEEEHSTTPMDDKGNEREGIWPPDEIKDVNHIEATNDNMRESVDSKRSDSSSTDSFAFPVLGWDWMGSPVQMPKPQEMQLRRRNQRARAVLLHCCRF